MIDRRQPADFGHGARVRRTEPDLELVALADGDLAPFARQALAEELDLVMLGRRPIGLELEHRALRPEPIHGGQVGSEAPDAW